MVGITATSFIVFAVFVCILYFVWKKHERQKQIAVLESLISKHIAIRDGQLDLVRQQLDEASAAKSQLWDTLGQLDFTELLDGLQNEVYTAVDAVRAYQRLALNAHERTNCIAEIIVGAAAEVEKLDRQYRGKQKPPLFGLPFSVKCTNQVKGQSCVSGFADELHSKDVYETDDCLVGCLRKAGAIPFVTTNVPQLSHGITCSNPIYGVTRHPLRPDRCTGGTSGGEAALIAAGGSLLGVGSDGGGSIRTPASFCGVAGFKASSLRMSRMHGSPFHQAPGRVLIEAGDGPMAPSVDALAACMRQFWNDADHEDPYMSPMPFNDQLYLSKRPLRIGFYLDDGYVAPLPPLQRAVEVVGDKLSKMGHEVVHFSLPGDIAHVYRMVTMAFFVDGGSYVTDKMKNDILHPHMASLMKFLQTSKYVKRLLAPLFPNKLGNFLRSHPWNVEELGRTFADIFEYRRLFASSWRTAGLDALLCPPYSVIAPPLPYNSVTGIGYSAIFNMLDYPCGVVPGYRVTQEDENDSLAYAVRDAIDVDVRGAAKGGIVGLPVGLQCVTRPHEEELCLNLMRQIESVM